MSRLLSWLSESYVTVIILSLLLGLLLPQAKYLITFSTFFLQVIFFLSSLKIDLQQVVGHLKDWKFLSLAVFIMLFDLLFLVWLVVQHIYPEPGLALFLLAAMSPGMTTPLLAEIAGGKQALAIVLTAVLSLLAPITIPLVAFLFYCATIQVDALGMFLKLIYVIFIPFILAMLVRRLVPKFCKTIQPVSKSFSISLLGLLIVSVVADQSHAILSL